MNQAESIDLQDSFVYDWKKEGNDLIFTVDFSLQPEHPRYSSPKENEWSCYSRGILTFKDVRDVSGLKLKEDTRHSIDPDGTVDFGTIDSFSEEKGNVRLCGEFGQTSFSCSDWTIHYDSNTKKTEPDASGQRR